MKIDLSKEEVGLLIDASWELYDSIRDNKKHIEESSSNLMNEFSEDGKCLYSTYYAQTVEAEKKVRDLIMKLHSAEEEK